MEQEKQQTHMAMWGKIGEHIFSPTSPPLANHHVGAFGFSPTPEALRSLRDRIAGLDARLSPGGSHRMVLTYVPWSKKPCGKFHRATWCFNQPKW